jgi:mannosyltransferase OCH1-like enzyme
MTLQNKISIKSELDGDFVLIGKYISQNECLIQVLRFDEDYGWPSFEILIDNTENIEIPESNISNFTYKIQTNTMLYLINTTTEQLIPKIIIQTHERSNFKDIYHQNAVETITNLNPEYEYIFFNDKERREFIKNNFEKSVLEAYDILVPGAYKADLFRYCYLYKNGGCYFDYKIIARKPLRDIIKKDDTLLICIDYDRNNNLNRNYGVGGYLNSIIMCCPQNINLLNLILECVNNILYKQHYFYNSINTRGYTDILLLTGPTLMYNILKNNVNDCNLKFKHIIKNNDESYYKNFQIVDIDSHEILFTKTYKTYADNNHYSKLWINKELFYKNKTDVLNLSIYVYPHPYNDVFTFLINKNHIYVERTDSTEQWWLNLQIKIVDNNTSDSEIVTIGRARQTPLQNIKPFLPTNVFLSTDITSSDLLINENNNIIIITENVTDYIPRIQTINNTIILAITNTNFDEIQKYSKIVDYIILYTGPDCYYYCFEKNIPYIYISLHISKLIENKNFKFFKFLKNNVSLNLIEKKYIKKYLNNSKKFLKTFTKNDEEFIKLNECLCLFETTKLYKEQIKKFNKILMNLNNIITESGESLEGNVFYEHGNLNNYNEFLEFENKRYNLFYYGRQSYNILEIGFNGGHSTLLYLISNPYSKIQLFDIGEHKYSKSCFEYLNKEFPNRLNIIWGDSTKTLEDFKTHIKYDFIHIDGGHTRYIAETDFYNCKELSDNDTLVLIDDTQSEPLLSLFEDFIFNKFVKNEKLEYYTQNHLLLKFIF